MNEFVKIIIIVAICLAVAALIILFCYIKLKNYKGHNRFILFLRFKVFRIKSKRPQYDAYYSIKPKYLSPYEEQYYNIINGILNEKYIIFPQVPLSQIVEKHSKSNYKNDLFRVIDFCIFDKTYYPLLCIEINDTTHLKKDRTRRDSKVAQILESARLPLLTLWTYEGIDADDIKKKLKQYNLV